MIRSHRTALRHARLVTVNPGTRHARFRRVHVTRQLSPGAGWSAIGRADRLPAVIAVIAAVVAAIISAIITGPLALTLIGLVAPDEATRRCAEHAVMGHIVPGHAAHECAPETAFGRRRFGHARERETDGREVKTSSHDRPFLCHC